MHIDWKDLANKLDCESSVGTRDACRAISEILGDDAIIEAVEYYITGRPGAELVRSILWHIHPKTGMDHCYKIYKEDSDIDRRRDAVELLRVVADERALGWVEEFLNDPDPGIQTWGAGVVDQLLFSHFVEEENCSVLLNTMKNHANPGVRRMHGLITEYLGDRKCDSD